MADMLGEDLTALRDKIKGAKPEKSAATVRRELDRKSMLTETDGRRVRGGVARDEQIKVPKGTKSRVMALARALDLSMVGAFERAIELLEAEADSKGIKK